MKREELLSSITKVICACPAPRDGKEFKTVIGRVAPELADVRLLDLLQELRIGDLFNLSDAIEAQAGKEAKGH